MQLEMKGLPWFRWLRQPVPVQQLDAEFGDGLLKTEWSELREKMEPGDKIWPFDVHVRRYLGMRRGFIVLRRGKPIGCIVTVSS
jgi:hypothetical protein